MNPSLDSLNSIINGYNEAVDKDRVFTYIQFVKMYGYQNDTNVFMTNYKDYVTKWAEAKKKSITLTNEQFVFSRLVEILKSITLDYSSYQEQDFIAHIDLNNKAHIKALISIYSRKIREITQFYRKKRNEIALVVRKNSSRGSTKSIEQVIYEKIFDYIFSNRNLVPSYKNLKRDLVISIQNYVDTYSDYFDIPRIKEFTDDTRKQMLTANINSIDYRMYLEIELVVSEILFSGNVMLEEIPLIAQLGLDLSQNCVGDMLALKNSLMANTTVNQVDLTEQIALKRRLYEKFLGCDLYYLYVDLQGNIQMDILCKALNPTGNLLNCGTADTATVENEQLTLLSHIGLFFKPNKTSILKINAKDYTWNIDTENVTKDTMYIFPDPNRYGDIGNNKDKSYPIIMQYDLRWDLRNASSGQAKNDPMMFITDQGWFSYYSKQEDDFKLFNNNNFDYSFTFLANKGYISNYQKDAWGNEFAIFKGQKIQKLSAKYILDQDNNENTTQEQIIFVRDERNGKLVDQQGGGKTIVTIYTPSKPFEFGEVDDEITDYFYQSTPMVINGGYFSDPFNPDKPFDYSIKQRISDTYNWSGLTIDNSIFFIPTTGYNSINYGHFGDNSQVVYEDHWRYVGDLKSSTNDQNEIIKDVISELFSINLVENPQKNEIELNFEQKDWKDLQKQSGILYVKRVDDYTKRPTMIQDDQVFKKYISVDDQILSFNIIQDTLVLETTKEIKFIPYKWDGQNFVDTLEMKQLLSIVKHGFMATKILYNEDKQCFDVLQLQTIEYGKRTVLVPHIYEFNCKKYQMKQVLNTYDLAYSQDYVKNKLDKIKIFKDYIDKKCEIIGDKKKYEQLLGEDNNLIDLEIPACCQIRGLGDVIFSYNSAFKKYLISFVINDMNGSPFLYEIQFRLGSFSQTLEVTIYSISDNSLQSVYVRQDGVVKTFPYNEEIDCIMQEEEGVNVKFGGTEWSSSDDLENQLEFWHERVSEQSEYYGIADIEDLVGKIPIYNSK